MSWSLSTEITGNRTGLCCPTPQEMSRVHCPGHFCISLKIGKKGIENAGYGKHASKLLLCRHKITCLQGDCPFNLSIGSQLDAHAFNMLRELSTLIQSNERWHKGILKRFMESFRCPPTSSISSQIPVSPALSPESRAGLLPL